ncbi:MAG TPA: DUF2304 domain-containing protein [Plantibacter sp.]|uniref:DUF2304 domain-containing protein n=1 Tax=unclassified Plantibacter TaxID=2624265 RepID=UPI002BDAA4AD|nr:DUF2304 domain-containing protein [Plantibacter sp.]
MIPLGTYILGILGAVLTLGIVIEMLRKRQLRERHAVWWLIAGILALVIGVFPQVLIWAAGVIGVEIPTNLVFFVSIFILFLVSIQHSSELTTLENRSRTLAEESALQDLRIRALEQRLADVQRGDSSTGGRA